jgi:hypothetical protein
MDPVHHIIDIIVNMRIGGRVQKHPIFYPDQLVLFDFRCESDETSILKCCFMRRICVCGHSPMTNFICGPHIHLTIKNLKNQCIKMLFHAAHMHVRTFTYDQLHMPAYSSNHKKSEKSMIPYALP